MKLALPAILILIIAVLGCALVHEIAEKRRIEKKWLEDAIIESVSYCEAFDSGDSGFVHWRNADLAGNFARRYKSVFGDAEDPHFANTLSNAFRIYYADRATNKLEWLPHYEWVQTNKPAR